MNRPYRLPVLFALFLNLCGAAIMPASAANIKPDPGIVTQSGPKGEPFFMPMQQAPFPFQGEFGDTGVPFFDSKHAKTGEPAHTNRYGEKIPASRYQDKQVLFYLPPDFVPGRPFFYLVFFHGLPSNPRADFDSHRLARQIKASGKNMILVMPPLASNAADASPGKFFTPGAFNSFINEVSTGLAKRFNAISTAQFSKAPVIVAAFSGGYKSAAYIVDRGGSGGRLIGVFLFDALFEDVDKFFGWLNSNRTGVFFLHIFGQGSCERNSQILIESLKQKNIDYATSWPKRLEPGDIHFIRVETSHNKIPSMGPPADPLARALAIIPGFKKTGDHKK